MSEKVLITGANGFKGSHLTAACLQQGLEVHAAIRKNSSMALFHTLVEPNSNLTVVDPVYDNAGELERYFGRERYHYVIHNAGITKAKDQKTYDKINAKLTFDLAKAVKASGIPISRFIHISSLAAIGPLSYAGGGTRPNPVTSYGRSKLLAEDMLREVDGLPVTVIRPTAVYGPGEKDLFIVFSLLAKGWNLNMGKAPQKLSFVFVRDLAEAIVLAMKKHTTDWLAFDISDGHEYTRYALSKTFKEISGINARSIHIPVGMVRTIARLNESLASLSGRQPALNLDKVKELTAENWLCDIQPAQNLLGYKPRYQLTDGIAETFQWYKNQKWL